jgi:ABC-type glycerol-3-phosphate transport system substrate-binding protein
MLAPATTHPTAVVMNVDMLTRAGLKVPAATWTWKDLVDYAAKLTQREGADITVYGAHTPINNGFGSMNFFGGPLWSHGGDWADRNTGKVTFQEPAGIAALEMIVDLTYKRQGGPTVQPDIWKGLQGSPFFNGKAAMEFVGSGNTRNYAQNLKSFQWTTVVLPREKKQGAHLVGDGWFVVNASKKKEAGAELVRLLSQPEFLVPWNTSGFAMVPHKGAANLKEWQDHLRANPFLAAYTETQKFMRAYPAIPGWNEASQGADGIGQGILDAIQGKLAPRQALEEAARRATATLALHAGG